MIVFLSAFMIISLYIVEKNLVVETKGYTHQLKAAELTNDEFAFTQRFFMSNGYLC
ncbi:poly-gamma-glutamate system protein, partial [Francisella tularensis subsp. holarctica]|nr:poly-gamma-glutamate system protein [Francisella tularensis subsp. holarctica]